MAVQASDSRAETIRALGKAIKGGRKEQWGNLLGYAFIAPALLLYVVFSVWPIFRGLTMAVTDYRFIYPETIWDFNGVQNFAEMLKDKVFWSSFSVSLRYTVMVVPALLALALFIAVIISRVQHLAGFYRWMIYLPTILPIAVTLLMWREFYDPTFGFINVTLRHWGVQNPPKWLGDVRLALGCVAVTDIWRGFGFPALLFLIGIYNINRELYEAASIDGATGWMQFWKITLPLLRPVLTLVLILNANILGATEQMMVMTAGGPQDATLSLGLYLYQIAFTFGDLRVGYAAAIGLAVGLLGATLTGFWFRILRPKGGE
jgi:multiple sugar transport system permease protein